MTRCAGAHALEDWQTRVIRWAMLFSLLFHAGAILLGTAVSSLFPGAAPLTIVEVELTEAPPTALREDEPPPSAEAASRNLPNEAPVEQPMGKPSGRKPLPSADRWLAKLDSSLARVTDAPVVGKTGRTGGLPVRRWENAAARRPGDFPPEVAPDKSLALGTHLAELEDRVRRSGRPGVGMGEEREAAVMFGGTGDPDGEPIPSWIRDMIRRKVRGYLPELEAAYSAAIRRNPQIKGRLLVRFRIDSSGNVQGADPATSSFVDDAFVSSVLERVRHWTFDPIAGRTVEVLYPFVFIGPS